MSYRTRELQEQRCAFCGRCRQEVRALVPGPVLFICDRCLVVCRQLLTERRNRPVSRGIRPCELKLGLDEWIVGQEHAKRILSVAVYNHLKRVALAGKSDIEISKSNILLIGPPGTGKTHIARSLARLLDLPFAIADATPLTQAGYIGEDVESIILKLFRAAENSAERTATGVIYLDEVDKLAKRPGQDRDVSGEGVQQALLKILEGKKVTIRPGANGVTGETIEIDTSNILFIAGGAFEGLLRNKEQQVSGHPGFLTDPESKGRRPDQVIHSSDLYSYGFLPEFVGRFPILVRLDSLDERALVRILTSPKDALLRQYQRLFAMDGARLDFTSEGLLAIARAAAARNSGARGLRAVLEDLLLDVMFNLPSSRGQRFILDAEVVSRGRPMHESERTAA